ncbi:MAG: DUF167 domain-containing protein [Phycisphaerales bacterium]|nr:MAG: DUF167 domain-containing protein [Phycisphaerales bacterium]
MSNLSTQEIDGGAAFVAKIVPGSSRTAVSGLLGGMLKVKVAAAPEKGKANQCLIEFLARQLGVKKNAVVIVSGATSPVKHIQVMGISGETLRKKLNVNEEKP